jgi:hypothetical protein
MVCSVRGNYDKGVKQVALLYTSAIAGRDGSSQAADTGLQRFPRTSSSQQGNNYMARLGVEDDLLAGSLNKMADSSG